MNSLSLYNAKFNTICNIFDSISDVELWVDLDPHLGFIEYIKNKFNDDQYSTIVNKIKNKVQNIHSTLQLPYILRIEWIELKQYFSEKFPNAKFDIDKLCSFYTKTNIERIIKSKIIQNINSEEDIEIFLQKQNIFDNDINNQRNSFNNYDTDFSDDLWSWAEYQNISEKSTDYEQKIEKLKIFWSDLLNQNLNSINESTWNIIDELKKWQSLLDKYLNNELNNSEKTELSQFLTSIHILFLHTKIDKWTWKPICEIGHEMDNIYEYLSKMDIKITALEKQLKIEKNNNSILNRLINIITNQKYNTMESLYEKKEELIKEYDNKWRLNYQKIIENWWKMPIRKWLLMNWFPVEYFENYIQSWVVGTERTRREQDYTKFMSDFVQSYEDYNDITSLRSLALHWLSDDWTVIEWSCIALFSEKNQDNIILPGVWNWTSHKTIRTWIESWEIECIFVWDSDNKLIVNKIKDMIVKHWRFIPLCDKEWNSLWTPKEFDDLKNIYDNEKGYFNWKSHKFNVTEWEARYYSKRMDGYLSQIQDNWDNLPTILAQLKEDINAEYKMVTWTDQNLDLTDEQLLSVLDAHEQDWILWELTLWQLKKKVKILSETIKDKNVRRFLLEAGFCGMEYSEKYKIFDKYERNINISKVNLLEQNILFDANAPSDWDFLSDQPSSFLSVPTNSIKWSEAIYWWKSRIKDNGEVVGWWRWENWMSWMKRDLMTTEWRSKMFVEKSPIELNRIKWFNWEDLYWVANDGNHRVVAAKEIWLSHILAEVKDKSIENGFEKIVETWDKKLVCSRIVRISKWYIDWEVKRNPSWKFELHFFSWAFDWCHLPNDRLSRYAYKYEQLYWPINDKVENILNDIEEDESKIFQYEYDNKKLNKILENYFSWNLDEIKKEFENKPNDDWMNEYLLKFL